MHGGRKDSAAGRICRKDLMDMTEKKYALDLDYSEWEEYMTGAFAEPNFRAGQICEWLWQKYVCEPSEMTNLSKDLRTALAERLDFAYPALQREQRSQDGTRKFLWRLRDREMVESVLLKEGSRLTLCMSTQVGCPLQCSFCATGQSGFVRSLSPGEIAGQLLAAEKHMGRQVNSVVYMGMGEPFLNTASVLKSVRMLNSPKMRRLGIRHITISTSGIIPGIEEFAASGLGARLAVSLHAADSELRSALMPVNRTYPLEELRSAMQRYQAVTGDRITIEYALFGGVNDSVEAARDLLRYLKGLHVFVNLIPANEVSGRFEKPRTEAVLRFRSVLESAGFECEIRAERGADIDAACGQLRRKTQSGEAAFKDKTASDSGNAPAGPDAALRRRGMKKEVGAKTGHEEDKEIKAGSVRTERKQFRPSGGFISEPAGRGRKKDARPASGRNGGKSGQKRQDTYGRGGSMKKTRGGEGYFDAEKGTSPGRASSVRTPGRQKPASSGNGPRRQKRGEHHEMTAQFRGGKTKRTGGSASFGAGGKQGTSGRGMKRNVRDKNSRARKSK